MNTLRHQSLSEQIEGDFPSAIIRDQENLISQLKSGVRAVRAAVKPPPGLPDPYHFFAKIVRLNRRDRIDISPSPLTCIPQESSTPEAARLIQTSRRYPSPSPREARVELWLGSDGAVVDAWIVRSAGRSELDSLALNVVRVLQYTPPVFGSMPAATLLQVPVRF